MAPLFDTSVISHYFARLAAKRTPQLFSRFKAILAAEQGGISFVTYYELERGVRKLELEGRGSAKRWEFEDFMEDVDTVALEDEPHWDVAAELYARAALHSPAIVLSDADLVTFATALVCDRRLVTSDGRLAARLTELGHAERVECLAVA